jgi:glyoxylase-like metal-dependent hydrolase (beta-lactamase superfamily II)
MARRIDIDFGESHAIEAQLDRLGFQVGDVGTVVASHLHFDHAGALKRFPHARTFVGAEELAYARSPERFASAWYREEDFADAHGIQWVELPADHDLFGDGAVTVLHLPGHTPGSLALLVRLGSRAVVLSGDVVHTRAAFEAEAAYQGDVDTVASRRSLRKLRHMLETHDADLWIAHNPDDWQRWGGAGEKRACP